MAEKTVELRCGDQSTGWCFGLQCDSSFVDGIELFVDGGAAQV